MEEHFISYSCIFISYIQCLEVSFQKSGYFSKKLIFPEFQLIQSDFRSIEILFKNLVSLCLVRLIVFQSIEHRVSSFLKNSALTDSNTFSKSFSNFSLSLQLGKAAQKIFCRSQPNFCKVFLPQGR